MAMKWFLNVRMCLSATFARWFWGGTYWIKGRGSREWRNWVRSVEDSLSVARCVMGWPWARKKEKMDL